MSLGENIAKYLKNKFDSLNHSETCNPISLESGQQCETTITINGAAIGYNVFASFSLRLNGIKLFSEVIAENTVQVVFFNMSDTTVDLDSGTLYIKVIKN